MSYEISESESFVDMPGGSIFVKRWTPEGFFSSLVPVILLHDSLGCVAAWRDFPRRLAAELGREVIAYDRIGFGRSASRFALPSFDFIREEAEVHLPALLAKLGFQRVSIFGHSVGGGIAISFAAAWPAMCESVISESAQAFVEEKTRRGIEVARAIFQRPESFGKLEKFHGDKTQWVLNAWTETWLSPAFADWSLVDVLPNVRCPLLAIHGENDEYGSIAFPNMLSSLAGGRSETRILSNCGHFPHREHLDLILKLVRTFLNG